MGLLLLLVIRVDMSGLHDNLQSSNKSNAENFFYDALTSTRLKSTRPIKYFYFLHSLSMRVL